jgi:hypothetical protein
MLKKILWYQKEEWMSPQDEMIIGGFCIISKGAGLIVLVTTLYVCLFL